MPEWGAEPESLVDLLRNRTQATPEGLAYGCLEEGEGDASTKFVRKIPGMDFRHEKDDTYVDDWVGR